MKIIKRSEINLRLESWSILNRLEKEFITTPGLAFHTVTENEYRILEAHFGKESIKKCTCMGLPIILKGEMENGKATKEATKKETIR